MYKHSTYIQFLQNYITKQKWTANALQVMTVITAEDGVAGFLHEDVIMVIKYCSNRRSLCSSQRLFNGFHPTATKGLVKSHQKLSQLFEISSHTQLVVKCNGMECARWAGQVYWITAHTCVLTSRLSDFNSTLTAVCLLLTLHKSCTLSYHDLEEQPESKTFSPWSSPGTVHILSSS